MSVDIPLYISQGPEVADPKSVEILVAGNPEREILASLSNLKALIVPWAGVSPDVIKLVKEFPTISLHNLHHNALPVAEYALSLLLCATNNLVVVDKALRQHNWLPRYDETPSSHLLSNKNYLILGYGHIGQAFSKLIKGFNPNIMAIRNTIPESQSVGNILVYPSNYLHQLLPNTDFLIITLPLTSQTKHFISEVELKLLPKHAVLINIGRGELIDQSALYTALKNRWIFSAGIDVWYNYPTSEAERSNTPPANFPFYQLDNIVMSPHRAGNLNKFEIENLRMTHLANLVNEYLKGNPMPNRVDIERGY